jgi:hypothetical protein
VSVDDVKVDMAELRNQLVPTLRTATLPRGKEITAWGEQLVSECRDLLSSVLPLRVDEREFIERLNDRGEIAPELLTGDGAMQTALREHPALRWKSLNVKQHRGWPSDDGAD